MCRDYTFWKLSSTTSNGWSRFSIVRHLVPYLAEFNHFSCWMPVLAWVSKNEARTKYISFSHVLNILLSRFWIWIWPNCRHCKVTLCACSVAAYFVLLTAEVPRKSAPHQACPTPELTRTLPGVAVPCFPGISIILAREAAVCSMFNPADPRPTAGAGLPDYCRVKNKAETW